MATKPLDNETIEKIISSIFLPQDVRNALLIELNTGLRIMDIAKLKFSQIQFGILELVEQKTKKTQITKINMDLVRYLNTNKTWSGDYMFLEAKRKRNGIEYCAPKSFVRYVQNKLKVVCECEHINHEFISTHSFRKTFATNAFNQTKDLVFVQKLLNHSSVSITQRYINVDQERIDNFREKIKMGF